MTLPAVVDNLEAVPEPVREFYRADADGKRFILDAEDMGTGAEEMRRALARVKDDNRKKGDTLSRYAALGKSPEEIENLLARETERERAEAEKKGQFDKLLVQKDEQYTKELSKKDAERTAALSLVERYVLDAEIAKAVAAHKGMLKLLAPLVKAQLQALSENGIYRVAVVDADGDERHNPKTNAPMTVAELVAEMRNDPDLGRAFESSGTTGGGAAATGARPSGLKTVSRAAFDEMSPIDKKEFIAAKGQVVDAH